MSTSKKKTALGRGFESLIPIELFDEEFDPTSQQDGKISQLINLKLNDIDVDKNQPRKNFDDASLLQLAESIKTHGVLQPIVVVKKAGRYQIVAGERRFRASKLAGKRTIPAIIRKLSDQNRLEISLIENLQRRNLSIIEVATSYLKLRDQFNLTLAEIGARVGGKTAGAVSNTLRLLRLPKAIIEALDQGRITEGQVRPLIGLDSVVAVRLAQDIEKYDYSARQVEAMVKKLKDTPSSKARKTARVDQSFIDNLAQKLKTKVQIKPRSSGAGKIEIAYKNTADFNRIKKLLQ